MAPPPVSEAAAAQVRAVARLEATALAAGRRAWRRVDQRFISESWTEAVRDLSPVVSAVQVRAAEAGASYGAATLAEQGTYIAPDAFVNPAAFGGVAADGRSLSGLLYSPATTAKGLIGEGMGAYQALGQARGALDRIMRTTVADAGRQAASVDVATRPGVGYVRMLNPPSCSRCVVLAGRSFRWNAGFLRHPRCDCVHVMTTVGSLQGAKAEGLISDPYDYFHGLPKAEQDRLWGANNARAIRDGADIFQVTNARRGVHGMFTTEGMSRRGYARQGLKPGQRRMTPDAIYRQAEGRPNPREFALDLLKTHGYVLPGGQNPLGSIVGQREGFGALGRGGTRKAASQAVLDARATGIRDGSRYTMTEAERRLYDAEQRWRMVQQGRNPYSAGFGRTPDPFGQQLNRAGVSRAPLTPKIAAQVEADYRRWLATGGQKFTRVLAATPTLALPSEVAARVVAAATAVEPGLTTGMAALADQVGGSLAGLNYRLKTVESLTKKITDDVLAGKKTAQQVADHVFDVNRYTILLKPDQYARSAQAAINQLRADGNTLTVKNYWRVPLTKNPYQGINVQITKQGGQRLELQFHTEVSLHVKEHELHGIYDLKKAEKDPVKLAEYARQSIAGAEKIPVPRGVAAVS